MSKLAGKVAVVTGASKGIGAGIAKALAKADPVVVLRGRGVSCATPNFTALVAKA